MRSRKFFTFCAMILVLAALLRSSECQADESSNENKPNKVTNLKPSKETPNQNDQASTAATTTTTTTTTTTAAPSPSSPPSPPAEPVRHLSERHRLKQDLLKGYKKDVHPVKNHDKPVDVGIGMAIIHFDIDEAKSVVSVDAWMRFLWTDENMPWDPEEYGGITQLHFTDKELWIPDVLLYNNADSTRFYPYGNAHLLVQHTGEVLWVPPAHLEAFCKMDFFYWPMDWHSCKLKFGSWTSHGDEISLNIYQNNTEIELLNFYTNNREWQISDMVASKREVHYSCCPEGYPEVMFKFIVKRDAPAYRSVIVLPCLVIMLMSICSYLLPPNAGEKLFLNGLAFIGCILYLIYFAMSLPFHQTTMPIIVLFYGNTCALVGIGLLLNTACINMSRVRRFSGPPKCLKSLFMGSIGKLLCLGNYVHQTSFTHQRLVLELTDMAESEQQSPESATTVHTPDDEEDRTLGLPKPTSEESIIMRDWLLVAAGLERLFFVIYSIIFAVVTSSYI